MLAVLRILRDAGALGDALKDEGLEADALELLTAAGAFFGDQPAEP